MDESEKFEREVQQNISNIALDEDIKALSRIWVREVSPYKYPYNFKWFGRPAIQLPTDAWALQEIVWEVQPDLIIECGIAHGGSLIYSASLLAMLDYCDAVRNKTILDPNKSARKVLGIDIDIRDHNKSKIENHPLSKNIEMIEGSSVDATIIEKVRIFSKKYKKIMLLLDSNHTMEHVSNELNAYANLVTKNSYCIVYDTLLEMMPKSLMGSKEWGLGNGPLSAVKNFLENNDNFEANTDIDNKLLITVAPNGFLKRIK